MASFGTIVAYALHDGVGHLELEDGEVLRFGLKNLIDLVPAVGARVRIGDTEPYPLGGRRALEVWLADEPARYEPLKVAYEKSLRNAMNVDTSHRAAEVGETVDPAALDARTPPLDRAPAGTRVPVRSFAKTVPRAATPVPSTAEPRAGRAAAHTVRRTPGAPPARAASEGATGKAPKASPSRGRRA